MSVVYQVYCIIFFLVGENPQHPIQGLSKATAEEEEEILDSLALLLSLQMLPCFSFSRHLQPSYSHHSISHCTMCTCLFHTLPKILWEILNNAILTIVKLMNFLRFSRIITSFIISSFWILSSLFHPSKYSPLSIIRPGRLIIFEENLHRVTVIWTGPKLDLERNSHQVPNLGRVARSFTELTSSVPFLDGVLFPLY